MNVNWPQPGKYIVAVSGGVDSVCLLDMLVAHGGYELIIAHVDHGIREDSSEDAVLVESLAQNYHLLIIATKLQLGKGVSEEVARAARYNFLYEEMKKQGASAILTAHHADDLLETSIMNVRRGTDRYGAAGGMNREGIARPLIKVSKKELLDYAKEHNLQWREDSTNLDVKYTRNEIRHNVIPTIDKIEYQRLLTELEDINQKLDSELAGLVSTSGEVITIRRSIVDRLGLREIEVLLAYAIRQCNPTIELTQPTIARLAREILLDTSKNSFSLSGVAGIIVEIP